MPSSGPRNHADDIVTVRLPASDRDAIQRLVDAGEYRNRTDFIRHAIKAELAKHAASAEAGADARASTPIEPLGELGEIPQSTEHGARRAPQGPRQASPR